MTEEEALWKSCEDMPECQIRRGVLADWLDERADGRVECPACRGRGRHHYEERREFGGERRWSAECGKCAGTGRVPNGYTALAAGLRGTKDRAPRKDYHSRPIWFWTAAGFWRLDHYYPQPHVVPDDVFAGLTTGQLSRQGAWRDYPTWRAAVEDLCRAWAAVHLGSEVGVS